MPDSAVALLDFATKGGTEMVGNSAVRIHGAVKGPHSLSVSEKKHRCYIDWNTVNFH